jgi:lipopolysaccharide cholinephosphotransferase
VISISPEQLRQLQQAQLQIALEVTNLCAKHGLPYLLLAGTALGARRHGGFIPWDDDMDLGMLRPHYDAFLEIAKREIGPDLYVQNWLDDPHMGAPFTKVRRNDSTMVEAWSKDTGGHKGIFIDVFPLDNVPDGPVARVLHKFQLALLKRLLRHNSGYTITPLSGIRGVFDAMVRFASRHISQSAAKRSLDRTMRRYSDRSTRQVVAVAGCYGYAKESLLREWAEKLTNRPFEGHDLLAPVQIDAYLEHLYGDFMKLPPEEQRGNKHSVIKLELTSQT